MRRDTFSCPVPSKNQVYVYVRARRQTTSEMGVLASLILFVLVVGLLVGGGYVMYGLYVREKEEVNSRVASQDERLKEMLGVGTQHERRLEEVVLDNERRSAEVQRRLRRHVIAARLRARSNEMQTRTQVIRLGPEDAASPVRLSSIPPSAPSSDSIPSPDGRLHLLGGSDGKTYAPLTADHVWARGGIRVGKGAGKGGSIQRVPTGGGGVAVLNNLYTPAVETDALEVRRGGLASFPGGRSRLNPKAWRSYLGDAGAGGRNYLRGDTELRGDLDALGAVRVGDGGLTLGPAPGRASADAPQWRLAGRDATDREPAGLGLSRVGSGGETAWVPVDVRDDGSIRLNGKVHICDEKGEGCRRLQGAPA